MVVISGRKDKVGLLNDGFLIGSLQSESLAIILKFLPVLLNPYACLDPVVEPCFFCQPPAEFFTNLSPGDRWCGHFGVYAVDRLSDSHFLRSPNEKVYNEACPLFCCVDVGSRLGVCRERPKLEAFKAEADGFVFVFVRRVARDHTQIELKRRREGKK